MRGQSARRKCEQNYKFTGRQGQRDRDLQFAGRAFRHAAGPKALGILVESPYAGAEGEHDPKTRTAGQ